MGRSASGRSIFGISSVSGRSRVAYPAARMSAFIAAGRPVRVA
jgi:hypothetical protein